MILICDLRKFENILKDRMAIDNSISKKYLQSLSGLFMLRMVIRALASKSDFVAGCNETCPASNSKIHMDECFQNYLENDFLDGVKIVSIDKLLNDQDIECLNSFFEDVYNTERKQSDLKIKDRFENLKKNLFSELNIGHMESGKPYLMAVDEKLGNSEYFEPDSFFFNISHSGNYVALVWDSHSEVGIDIEDVSRGHKSLSLAKRFFSQEEMDYLLGLEEQKVSEEFIRLWCRKESYGKMVGTGLSESILRMNMQDTKMDDFFMEYELDQHYRLCICKDRKERRSE